jgi:hypothetical protein
MENGNGLESEAEQIFCFEGDKITKTGENA